MAEVITAINAKPETIKNFLGIHDYVIPDYQRSYSWGKEECVKLWEDFTTFFEDKKNSDSGSPYFLGNVVIYNDNKKRCVVDGQQRLITLNLLIRALFNKCNSFTILERLLYRLSPITGEIINPYEIRIEHNVLGDNENKKLNDALHNQLIESKYKENYDLFYERIVDYFQTQNYDARQIETFILTLIDNVVVLPIECTDFESALTIFETINNRGMDLNDSDIFKSKLYKFSSNEKELFIKRWNELVPSVNENGLELKDIFSHYMHVLRGKEKNVDSIVGLRKFYDQKGSYRLKNWHDVMNSLDKLVLGWNYITSKDNEASSNILNWCKVLAKYPNSYWEYPIMVYLHKHIYKNGDEFLFKKEEEFLVLIKETVRYCYWKWLKFRGINAIKDTIFKVVREVANDGDYKNIYKEDIKSDIKESGVKGMQTAIKSILNLDLGKGLTGICLLSAILNTEQRRLIPLEIQIEHILPHKWEHYKYNGWDNSSFNQYHEKLGNLVVLEKSLNIKSSHRFFAEKKNYYNRSEIFEVRELGNLREWTPKDFKDRNSKIIDRLTTFLSEQ